MKGIITMSKAMEDMRNDSVLENSKQIAEITNLFVEEVEGLAEGKLA